jgi:hypothetical protein
MVNPFGKKKKLEVEARLKRKQLKLKEKFAPKLQKLKSTKMDGSFSNTTPSKDAKSQVEV